MRNSGVAPWPRGHKILWGGSLIWTAPAELKDLKDVEILFFGNRDLCVHRSHTVQETKNWPLNYTNLELQVAYKGTKNVTANFTPCLHPTHTLVLVHELFHPYILHLPFRSDFHLSKWSFCQLLIDKQVILNTACLWELFPELPA